MKSMLYPEIFPYRNGYGVTKVISPSWKNNLEHLHLKILSLFLAALLFTISSFGQGACPTSNCVSGDMTITKVELVDATTLGPLPNICQPGQGSAAVKLKVTFDATAGTRYGFLIIGDIKINGQFLSRIWQCYPEDFVQGSHTRVLDQVIQWPCGSTISLSDVYTAWRHQAPSTTICTYLNPDGTISSLNCGNIDPKCKYYGEQSFTIAAPLVANFTYGGTCGPNDLYKPITFTSSTTGGNTPYQYSWEIKDAVTNAVLATSTSNPYTYTPQSGNNLSVKLTITDASSTQQSDDETKTVTVTSCCESPTVSSNPQNQPKCQGTSASFSVGYTGGNPVPGIQWQISTDGGTNWANVPNSAPYSGVTSGTLNISSVTLAMNNYKYKAILKSGMCAAVESNPATLNVDPTSVGGTVAAAQTICYGNQPNSNLILSGNTGSVLKWQRSTDNFVSNSSDIANTTTTLTAAAIGVLTQDTWFRAVVKSGQCSEANSSIIKITVNVLSVSGTIASAQTICYGNQPNSNLMLSGNTGSVVKWQKSTDNFVSNSSDIANTTTTLTAAAIGVLTQDTWFRVLVKNGECPDITSASIKITVNPTSVGGSVASNQTICSGNQPNSNLILSGHTGSVVKWQRSTTSNFTMATTSDIANTTATLSAASIGALTQDTWFRAVVKSGVCSETTSDPVKISVQLPIGNNTVAASQVICSGNTPNGLTGSTPTGGDGNYTYQWQSRSGGGWSNIQNATGKDYPPGALSQNTEFRRIVSAGSACSNNTSASVTISMSPESQVYAIQGSNFCQSAPNTGTVKLMGSYPNVSYQLKNASDNSDVQNPKIGNGSALTWTDLPAGTYYVYGTGTAPTSCPSQTATVTVRMFDCSVFYTLTQGYYGGKNGKSCIGTNPVNTIKYLLGNVDLVVGTTNSITIPATNDGAIKLNQTMPGGSTPEALPPVGNCTITTGCFTDPTYLTKQGRINNVFLSQTITLSLNVRWNNGELLLFPVKNGYLTTQKMKGCGENAVLVEVCESGTIFSKLMNQNVVNYLGSNATVADLLQLANDVLGGTKTPGVNGVPSYADVNDAVSTINEAFDEGRRFLNYFETKQTCEMLFPTPALPAGTATTTLVSAYRESIDPITVTAYPNPFSDNINFQIETKQSGQGSLEVYNMTGQKLKTVFNGHMNAGRQRFSMTVPPGKSAVLFYVFRLGDQKVTGKLFQSTGR